MSRATEELMHEHRAIERVIGLLFQASEKIQSGETVPVDSLAKAHGFIRNFADQCHHAKEEGVLFKMMGEKGVPTQGGPIGVMLMEHDQGRRYAAGIKAALPGYAEGDREASASLVSSIRGYGNLLLAHIQKEDQILYPLSDRIFSEAEKTELMDEFERVEREVTGPGEHEKHMALIDELQAVVA
jgi:hemerythrin-like domain-containing protein